MTGWSEAPPPQPARVTAAGWVRLGLRGLALALVAYGGLLILLALRLIERPLFGPARPWTPHVTQTVCRAAMRIFGFGYKVTGRPMRGPMNSRRPARSAAAMRCASATKRRGGSIPLPAAPAASSAVRRLSSI